MARQDVEAARLKAFLKLIQYAENAQHEVDHPYQMLYGGGHFTNMMTHPNKKVSRWGHSSTAAGAFFINKETYDEAVRHGVAHDFSEASQDAIAIDIIRRAGATSVIEAGNFDAAFAMLSRRWPSLPGGGQQEITAEDSKRYLSRRMELAF